MNRKTILLILMLVIVTSCGDRGKVAPADDDASAATGTRSGKSAGTRTGKSANTPAGTQATSAAAPSELVLIASDIVTDVIIRPDPEGDPWEIEKVAGYKGDIMVNTIFDRIYEGTLTAYEYHSGEPMTPGEVKKIEKEFTNDRSKIGKLSFTEDWYYDPVNNNISKITKSVVFGYELYNGERKVYAYRAAFRADLGSIGSTSSGNNP